MGRPAIPRGERRIKCPTHHIMMPGWVYDELGAEAKRQGVTIKATIEKALTTFAARTKKRAERQSA